MLSKALPSLETTSRAWNAIKEIGGVCESLSRLKRLFMYLDEGKGDCGGTGDTTYVCRTKVLGEGR